MKTTEIAESNSFGDRLSDKITSFGGSWTFILSFISFIIIWIVLNVLFFITNEVDPYPFILLNLILSCIAALQAPVIMMSQKRQESRDRKRAKNDYEINIKAEQEIEELHQKFDILIDGNKEILDLLQNKNSHK